MSQTTLCVCGSCRTSAIRQLLCFDTSVLSSYPDPDMPSIGLSTRTSCFGTVIEGFHYVVRRIHRMLGREFVDNPKKHLLKNGIILVRAGEPESQPLLLVE